LIIAESYYNVIWSLDSELTKLVPLAHKKIVVISIDLHILTHYEWLAITNTFILLLYCSCMLDRMELMLYYNSSFYFLLYHCSIVNDPFQLHHLNNITDRSRNVLLTYFVSVLMSLNEYLLNIYYTWNLNTSQSQVNRANSRGVSASIITLCVLL